MAPDVNPDKSPLGRLARRRGKAAPFLDEAETVAGERLRSDYTRARLMPGITQRWDLQPRQRPGPGGARDLSDSAIDARARVDEALEAVGPELSGVLVNVCCFLKGLEVVERERQWPARSAKLMLKAGLAALARHYGVRAGGAGSGRIRRWGADDYRPRIGGGGGGGGGQSAP